MCFTWFLRGVILIISLSNILPTRIKLHYQSSGLYTHRHTAYTSSNILYFSPFCFGSEENSHNYTMNALVTMNARTTSCLLLFVLVFSCVTVSSVTALTTNVQCKPKVVGIDIVVPTCQKTRISVKQCVGTCLSYSVPDGKTGLMKSTCNCCKAIKTSIIRVELYCQTSSNGYKLQSHDIRTAEDCSCLPC